MMSCCGSCTNFSYAKTVSNPDALLQLASNGSADILFPVLGETTSSSIHGAFYVPLIFIPGGTLLYIRDLSAKAVASQLIEAVFQIWPLITIALLLALVAGVVIWFMVCKSVLFFTLRPHLHYANLSW